MERQLIKDGIDLFLHGIITIQDFIQENMWGDEILKKVVRGEIPRSKINIKNSSIKSYFFHGTGCDFRFKSNSIDVSLINDIVSFDIWSLLMYLKNEVNEVNEVIVNNYIEKLVEEKSLAKRGECFFLPL